EVQQILIGVERTAANSKARDSSPHVSGADLLQAGRRQIHFEGNGVIGRITTVAAVKCKGSLHLIVVTIIGFGSEELRDRVAVFRNRRFDVVASKQISGVINLDGLSDSAAHSGNGGRGNRCWIYSIARIQVGSGVNNPIRTNSHLIV